MDVGKLCRTYLEGHDRAHASKNSPRNSRRRIAAFFCGFLFFLSSLAANAEPEKLAILSGTETTSPTSPIDLNQATPYAMKWSQSSFDSSYFTHSTSSFSHEVKVNVSGDYLLSLTLPLVLNDTSNNRRAILAEVYLNGNPVEYTRMASSYMRQNGGHNESSLHGTFVLNNLSANDSITVYLNQDVTTGEVTTAGGQLMVQFLDSQRDFFIATATQTTNSTNLNQSTAYPLEWSSVEKDSGFTHSDSVNPQNLVLDDAGDYLVFVNVPMERDGACSGSNDRINVQALVQLDGATVTGGTASQGYLRCFEGHQRSSVHWVGLLSGVTAGQTLSVSTRAETTVTNSAIVPASRQASLVVEKLSDTSEVLQLSGTQLLTGDDWNPSATSEVNWSTQTVIDSATYTHSTSSNAHQVTVDVDGTYLLLYTDHMTTTATRTNNIVRVKKNGSVQSSGQCKTHYIRNNTGHNESSCSLSYVLQDLQSGDTISVELAVEAATGTVNDASPAVLTLRRLADADVSTCADVVDCTPDLVLHVDADDFSSILDSSSRDAGDISFSGSAQTWQDISQSANVHNLTQTSASQQPVFDPINRAMSFDGTNDGFEVVNHPDLNTADSLKERSIILAFTTGSDVTSPQVIYEEGGTVRGMNVYIRNGSLFIGFWNINDDGDGAQPFTSASTPVNPNTIYFTSLVIDYSNYTGPSGPDGQLRGHINGVEFAALGTTTSLLYNHPGDIGLGFKNNGSYYDNGATGGTGDYFEGDIFELLLFNHAIDNTEAIDFYNYLKDKWPDPYPVTGLQLSSSYTSLSTQTPSFSWTASLSSDVLRYEVALGTTAGATDVSDWASVALNTNAIISGLSLSECVDYYASVRAIDSDGNESPIESTSFLRYDGTAPSDPSGLTLSGTSSTTASKVLSWSNSVDSCAFSHYEAAIGTSSGSDDTVAWTDIDNVITYQFTGISPALVNSTDYYLSVRAVDQAGNSSAIASSSAWQVDTCVATDVTPPTAPGTVAISGSAGPTTSPQQSWSASSDSCGFSHYEIAIGSTSGASDVVAYSSIGNVLTQKLFSISPSLSTNTDYYTSVRAVDLAGNTSTTSSSVAWQLSTPGDVSDGLTLWLDAGDTSTVFSDAGCSTEASDGGTVECWRDKSASGNNATASGSARPLFETGEFNAQPVIRFDGTDDAVDFTAISDIRTVFVVNKSTSSSFQPLLGHTSTRDFYTANAVLIGPTISSADLRSGSWRVDQVDVSSPTTFTQSGSFSLISVVTAGNVEADHLASDLKTSGRFFAGDVAELIVYNRALSTQEVVDVENYLQGKWFTANPNPVTSLSFDSSYTPSSSQSPSLSWTHSTASDLSHYEVALGSAAGSNDIAGWINIGLVNSYQFLGLTLPECTDFYASVRAVDIDGFTSSIASTAFARFDGTAPGAASGLILSGSASPSTSQLVTFTAGSDSCSFSHYEVALGTVSSGDDVISWVDIGNQLNHQFTGISPDLLYSTNYYLSVRAVDSAGNTSSIASSSAWQLDSCVQSDTTAPTTPGNPVASGNATVTRSQLLSWEAATDACALSHYEVALGTTSGGNEVVTWTDVGTSLSHNFFDLASNLSFSTNYYLSVRAVDQAGNTSSSASSNSWQLFEPGSVSTSGLELWIDVDDSQTVFQNDTCSTGITGDGQNAGCVKDKSGNDRHATNSTGGSQPVYQSAQFSNKPSLYFDGSADQFLDFGALSDIRTVFWVLKEDVSNPGNTAFLLGDPAGVTFDFHRDSTAGPIFSAANASASVTGGTLQINTVSVDGTTTNMPSSESVLSLVTAGNVTASAFSRDRTSCCGSRTWGGSLAEVLIFNRALSTTEVEDVENYLLSKWSISAGSTDWTGAVSTDWFNASNWSAGVPDANRDCTITDKTNDPLISSGTAICRSFDLSGGTLTLQNGGGAVLAIHGDFNNAGTFNQNDGVIEFRDDGTVALDQTLQSVGTLDSVRFDKTAGGSVALVGSTLTVNDLALSSGNLFTFEVSSGMTLTLPNGASVSGGTFDIQSAATVEVGDGSQLLVDGGTLKTSGTNDAYPQTTSNKAKITRQGSSGRWSFLATSGSVSLTGFLLEYLDSDGLFISGSADLTALDGGQFTYLDTDYVTPVKALQLNTTASLSETTASNVGFNWADANAAHTGIPDQNDNYFTVYAPNCNNSVLVFDQWFGDFFNPATNAPLTEDKIFDDDDGSPTCSISMSLAASPVNLLSFGAEAYDAQVALQWETGAEIDHLGFNVLRAENLTDEFTQINDELIRNFQNTTTFRGDYHFVDQNLVNGQLYYYMIEDISIDGKVERHGPVSARPLAGLGDPPPFDPESNSTTPDDSDSDLGEGIDLVNNTNSTYRVAITPSAIEITDANWNASYKDVSIPGYSKTLTPGHPQLLERKILIETKKTFSSIEVVERELLSEDISASLSGSKVTPAPSWNLVNGQLEAQYAEDSAAYSQSSLQPALYYSVTPQSVMINGRPYLEIQVSAVRYDVSVDQLLRLTRLVLDIGIEGEVWQQDPPPADQQVAPASVEGNLRIQYEAAGFYEVSFEDIELAESEGPFDGVDIELLRLYHHGKEIPLEVDSGDEYFGPGDFLRFWAPYQENIEDLLDEVVLTSFDLGTIEYQTGDDPGPLSIQTVANQPQAHPLAAPSSIRRTETVFAENMPLFDVPLGGLVDRFYWRRLVTLGGSTPDAGSQLDFQMNLAHLDSSAEDNVKVTVSLRGRGVFSQNPIHHIGIYLNGEGFIADSRTFTGTQPQDLVFEFAPARFTNGANDFRLEVLGDQVPTGDYDLVDINQVTVEYQQALRADQGQIHLDDLEPGQQVIIDGFESQVLHIYDLSDEENPMKYTEAVIEDLGGDFLVQFDTIPGPQSRSGQKISIVEDGYFQSPKALLLADGNLLSLRDTSNTADLLVIGSSDLLRVADPLIRHRENQGLLVVPAPLHEIEAEFSHGRTSSYGIREFLQYAAEHWQRAPKYLLILGDATYDPNDHLEYLPTEELLSVPIESGVHVDFGSDNFYVESTESHIPTIAIGRIPTSDEEKLAQYIEKVLAYEAGERSPAASQAKSSTFISGEDLLNEGFSQEVEEISQALKAADQSFITEQVHRSELASDAEVKQRILEEFTRGPLLMTYMGHGAENLWGSSDIFSQTDAASLDNEQLPITIALNCLNNYYYDADPEVISLGEELIFNPDGGSIAFWGSTAMTSPEAQSNLATSVMSSLGQKSSQAYQETRLGDLILNAKVSQGNGEHAKDAIRSYILFGDPTLLLPEESFSPAASDVEVIPPAQTESSPSGGGGGCSVFAADDTTQAPQPTWVSAAQQLSFLLFVLLVWGVLRFAHKVRD